MGNASWASIHVNASLQSSLCCKSGTENIVSVTLQPNIHTGQIPTGYLDQVKYDYRNLGGSLSIEDLTMTGYSGEMEKCLP